MRIRNIAGTMIGATAACLAFASQASAAVSPPSDGWDHTWTTTDSAHGGTVYVEENGDLIEDCDTAADGLAPRVFVSWSVGGAEYMYDMDASGGNGSCVYHDASEGGIYNLPENTTISVTIALGSDLEWPGGGSYLNDH